MVLLDVLHTWLESNSGLKYYHSFLDSWVRRVKRKAFDTTNKIILILLVFTFCLKKL